MASLTLLLLHLLLIVSAASAWSTNTYRFFGGSLTFTPKGQNSAGKYEVELRNKQTTRYCNLNNYVCSYGNCGRQVQTTNKVVAWDSYGIAWCQYEVVKKIELNGNFPFEIRYPTTINSMTGKGYWLQNTRGSYNGWRMMAHVDLGTRSDTGESNRSPITTMLPILRVPRNCPRSFNMTVFDPDGDHVRCRIATKSNRYECGLCGLTGGFTLVENSCSLKYKNGGAAGYYPIELLVEDFPNKPIRLSYAGGSFTEKNPHSGARRKRDTSLFTWIWDSSTAAPTATVPTTAAPTTAAPTTAAPTTAAPTTAAPTTTVPTTAAPTTTAPTTAAPTTTVPTTAAPTTTVPTTAAPTTAAPTTAAPTTTAPTTAAPTTAAPTTTVPTTAAPTTAAPTTAAPTSTVPTTAAPTTTVPTTAAPTTTVPTTAAPTTAAPTSTVPTTARPTTTVPTTAAPTTAPPTTAAPTSTAPTTAAPTSTAPTTAAPTSTAPTTAAPTTTAPTIPITPFEPKIPALSRLPLQFTVKVDSFFAPSCIDGDYFPIFTSPTPSHGVNLPVFVNKTLEIKVKTKARHSTIHGLIVTGPAGISKKKISTEEYVIKWTPTENELNDHFPICFVSEARDKYYRIYHSELRCVVVDVGHYETVVTCNETTLMVEVEKSYLIRRNEDNLHVNDFTDASCNLATLSNKTHLVAVMSLDKCGTTIEEDKDNIIFKNKITSANRNEIISRQHDVEIVFSCVYPKQTNLTLGFKHKNPYAFREKGFGAFTFQFEFFESQLFTNQIDSSTYPVQVYLKEMMFMQIEATTSIPNTELFVESCRATPYDNPNSRISYTIIEHGCVKDNTVKIYPSSKSQFRFGMEAFEFIGAHEDVYITCSVILCETGVPGTRCTRGCISSSSGSSRRKREAVAETSRHSISQGPLQLAKISDSQASGPSLNLGMNLVFIVGCLLVCVVVIYRSRRSKSKYQPLPTFETD